MKKTFLCLFLFSTTAVAIAQPSKKDIEKHQKEVERSLKKGKIVISLDTVFNKGVPYCIAKTLKKGFMGRGGSYDFYELGGKNVFVTTADEEVESYQLTFIDNGTKINAPTDVSFIEDHIVANGLFKDGKLDETAVKKYIMLNKDNRDQQLRERERSENTKLARIAGAAKSIGLGGGDNDGPTPKTQNIELVDRDRSALVFVMGEKIQQDNKKVGTIKEDNDSEGRKRFKVYTQSGTLVAECVCTDFFCKKIKILTFKNNENYTFTPPSGSTEDRLVEHLIERGFL